MYTSPRCVIMKQSTKMSAQYTLFSSSAFIDPCSFFPD
jgi:hypothetical protein